MVIIGSKIDEVRVDGQLGQVKKDLTTYEQIGLKAAEIPVHGLDAIRNGRLDARVVTKASDLLGSFDFKYSVHAPNPLNLMDRENPGLHLDVFRASLAFAEAIGAETLVYHPGRFVAEEEFTVNVPAPGEAEKRRLLEEEASTIGQLAKDFRQVTICMENARPYLVHSPYCYAEQISPLKEQVLKINRDNVRITLDIGHMYMSSKFYGFDCVEAVKSIARPDRSHACARQLRRGHIPAPEDTDASDPPGKRRLPHARRLGKRAHRGHTRRLPGWLRGHVHDGAAQQVFRSPGGIKG